MPDNSTRPRLDATKVSPDLYKAMLGVEKYVDASGLEQKLLESSHTRTSQRERISLSSWRAKARPLLA